MKVGKNKLNTLYSLPPKNQKFLKKKLVKRYI